MNQSDQPRTIRVFISSTFRDMFEEREVLVKRVFPQLRKLCEERGVTWGEVDLRWGVPDEKKAEGKVLPICLEEIKRCRPYFIGILGERYGWVPDEMPPDLVNREPWLRENLKHSVTELEILHGVLNDPAMAGTSFFYFRDPAYLDRLPKGVERSDFVSESPEVADKLSSLKERIRASGMPVQEDYPGPKALGELVLKDLTRVIEELFPAESKPDPLDREAAEHEAFAKSRARVYIGRDEYFKRLDEHAASDGPPLVVLGESGSGKSALLANWALKRRTEHPDGLLVMHFIGASPGSSDWTAMLRRVMGEFKRRLRVQGDIPDKPDELRAAFANWLHMAAARGKVILMLDALNQLEDRDGAPDLVWLPPAVPANVRLVVSTLPGRPLDDLQKRGWPTLTVQPLTTDERARFIKNYLEQYTKELGSEQSARIAQAEQAANPLFLQVLLEELRLFGRHEELESRIALYLKAKDTPALYEQVLARYEEDYEDDRPGLVRDAFTAIWAARRGLSEVELLDILGKDGNPLARAFWSPLFLAAEQALVSRAGLLNFFHDFLRAAVKNRYLPGEKEQAAAHIRQADYFASLRTDVRQAEELPWSLLQARSRDRLRDCLLDIDRVLLMKSRNEEELRGYWIWLRQERTMGSSYLGRFERWASRECIADVSIAAAADSLAKFLQGAALYNEAESLYRRALALDELSFGYEHPNVATRVNNLAQLFHYTNRLAVAEPLMRRALEIDERALGLSHLAVARDLCSLAELLLDAECYAEAEPLVRRAQAIREENLGDSSPEVAFVLNMLAAILSKTGREVEAEELYRRVLEISERSSGRNSPDVAKALNNLALLLENTDRPEEAEPLLRRALEIDQRSFGDDHPAVAIRLSNLACLLSETGRASEAQALAERALSVFTVSLGSSHPYTQGARENVFIVLVTGRKYLRALKFAPALLRALFRTLLGIRVWRRGRPSGHAAPVIDGRAVLRNR